MARNEHFTSSRDDLSSQSNIYIHHWFLGWHRYGAPEGWRSITKAGWAQVGESLFRCDTNRASESHSINYDPCQTVELILIETLRCTRPVRLISQINSMEFYRAIFTTSLSWLRLTNCQQRNYRVKNYVSIAFIPVENIFFIFPNWKSG